jgi:hypothetical protein
VILLGFGRNVQFKQFDRAQIKMNVESLQGTLPLRISAFHMCHPPTFFSIIYPIIRLFMSERIRKRMKVHSGSEKSVARVMQDKYGMTKDVLPTELMGHVVIDHQGWVRQRLEAGL